MIVCSCNVLTEVEIRASIATPNGPRRVCDVYASLGCAAKCGGCAVTISALISEAEKRDFAVERMKQSGEAGRMDARGCEGCDAESLWQIAASTDAALELIGQE
jgi:bacterioferritin-associated ferredoxin